MRFADLRFVITVAAAGIGGDSARLAASSGTPGVLDREVGV